MPTATTLTRARVSPAPLPSLEDADLVRRARDGDERAFEEIVRRYRAPLIRYSARHVGRDNAEDVTQHALARAAAHLRDDPRPIHLRAWLYRVAHNAAINMRARKDFSHEELSPEIDGVPQPPELAAQRSEVRQVVSDLDRLPERQRTALLLSVFEGLGYEEIAARLDTSPNSVRALLSRARVHLRKAATALAPLPLLESLVRKVTALAGGAGGSSGTVVAGGTVVQAKLVAIAATTVVAGAATAEQAASDNEPSAGSGVPALAQAAPAIRAAAVPLDVEHMLPHVPAPTTPEPRATPPPPPPAPQPPVEPVPPVATPVPEPVPEAPVEEAPPVDEPPAEPAPEAPKEEEETFENHPPPADGIDPPAEGGTPPEGYTPTPSGGYGQP